MPVGCISCPILIYSNNATGCSGSKKREKGKKKRKRDDGQEEMEKRDRLAQSKIRIERVAYQFIFLAFSIYPFVSCLSQRQKIRRDLKKSEDTRGIRLMT